MIPTQEQGLTPLFLGDQRNLPGTELIKTLTKVLKKRSNSPGVINDKKIKKEGPEKKVLLSLGISVNSWQAKTWVYNNPCT